MNTYCVQIDWDQTHYVDAQSPRQALCKAIRFMIYSDMKGRPLNKGAVYLLEETPFGVYDEKIVAEFTEAQYDLIWKNEIILENCREKRSKYREGWIESEIPGEYYDEIAVIMAGLSIARDVRLEILDGDDADGLLSPVQDG